MNAPLCPFEGAYIGMAVLDGDGICVRANRALATLLGVTPEALVGRALEVAGADEVLRARTAPLEYERELPGGRWALVTLCAPDPAQLVLTAQDITSRKAAETELRRSEATFRTMFEDSSVGIALVDPDGHFVQVNHAHAAMNGRTPGELVGVHFSELVPQDLRDERVDSYDESSADADVSGVGLDVPSLRPDGTPGWVTVDYSITRDDEGRPLHNVVQVRDVTDRKLAEQALRESEERYRSLIEHLPLGIFRRPLDPRDGGSYASPQMQELLGYSSADWNADAELLVDRIHPDDRERVLQQRRRLAEHEDFAAEYRMIARDGRELTVRSHATVLEQNGRGFIQGYMQDVSEQRQLEQQLRIAQKLESIGQLAAGIAHQINTPIQFVSDSLAFVRGGFDDLLALIDVLEAAQGTDPELRSAVRDARERADLDYLRERLPAAFDRTTDGIERVAKIVRAVRQFAQPEGEPHAPIDVNAALLNTLDLSHSEYTGVADVETDLGVLPLVVADAGELNQVFAHLVVNASHAIADVVGDSGERGSIRVTTRLEGADVVITVADTGCGIPAEYAERIFDPFFTTKDFGTGTGQGLAVAHAIICERHRGKLTVESRPGLGSSFEMRLPPVASELR